MEVKGFGAKLRELRQRARMTQKELADKVGIDFTYLSKIENGVMPPPSEKVILKLAEVLNADKDELMLLAGKIPSDIAQVLKNGETLQFLRSDGTRKVIRASNKIRRNVETLELLTSEGTQKMIGASNKIRRSLQMFNYNKSFSKVAIGLVLVLAVIGSLWFASPTPTKAIELSVPQASGNIASTATITATINVQSADVLPVKSVDLQIFNNTLSETFQSLPLSTQSGVSYTGTPNNSLATISAVAGPGWGYGYGTNRGGYGYGYQSGSWLGWGYHNVAGYTFGYGYYPPGGATSIAYTIVWNVPSNWPAGNYTIRLWVNANGKSFVEDGTLTLSVAPVGVGAGAPAAPAPAPGVTDVSANVDPTGVFTADVSAQSADANVTLTIETGTQGLTAEGTPIQEISIQPTEEPPPAPEGATVIDEAGTFVSTVEDITFIGIPYEFGPPGATFSEPIAITLNLPAELPVGIDPSNLRIGWWDPAAGSWVILETTFDPATNTLTAETDHFSIFAIIAVPTRPAAFTASDLTIHPAEVDVGKEVTCIAKITNTGDLSGSYRVTFKIDNVVVATKEVTLSGGDSKLVTFTITKDKAGTYTVNVVGLTGTFVVKPVPVPPVPPAPAAFEVSQLSISPIEVQVGEKVTVSATVANTGEVEGSYTVTLKINGATEATKKVTVAGGQSTKVTFSVVRDVDGSYQVDIDGQTGSFTVAKAPLAWWIWLIVGLVVVAVIVVVVILLRRRTY